MEQIATAHYPLFPMAMGVALTRAQAWRHAVTGENFDPLQLAAFAVTPEAKAPDGGFFLVSSEGAIGRCPGLEHETQWLFVPILDNAERDAVLARMAERIHGEAMKSSVGDSVPAQEPNTAPVPAPVPAPDPAPVRQTPETRSQSPEPEAAPGSTPEEPEQAPVKAPARFCPECGTPYKSDTARFCINCGTPRKL